MINIYYYFRNFESTNKNHIKGTDNRTTAYKRRSLSPMSDTGHTDNSSSRGVSVESSRTTNTLNSSIYDLNYNKNNVLYKNNVSRSSSSSPMRKRTRQSSPPPSHRARKDTNNSNNHHNYINKYTQNTNVIHNINRNKEYDLDKDISRGHNSGNSTLITTTNTTTTQKGINSGPHNYDSSANVLFSLVSTTVEDSPTHSLTTTTASATTTAGHTLQTPPSSTSTMYTDTSPTPHLSPTPPPLPHIARRYEDLPLEFWERSEGCKTAKIDHMDRLDDFSGSREWLVLATTLWEADTVLERNMFPCKYICNVCISYIVF